MSNALFLTDVSPEIGLGHLARSVALQTVAEGMGLPGTVMTSHSGCAIGQALYGDSVSFKVLSRELKASIFELRECLSVNEVDYVFVDSYNIDFVWTSELKSLVKKFVVLDDLANRALECDVLINPSVGITRNDYKGKISDNVQFLGGIEFAVLHPEFSAISVDREFHDDIRRILVNFGGTDVNALTVPVVKEILSSSFTGDIDVVVSSASASFSEVESAFSSNSRVVLHVDTPKMLQLMLAADLAVGAGGVSALERCAAGLPSLLLQTSDNQAANVNLILKSGSAIDIGDSDEFTPDMVTTILEESLLCKTQRQKMSFCGKKLCDAKGASRILSQVFKLRNVDVSK